MDNVLSLNVDMSTLAVVRSADMGWQASLSPTVWHKRLYFDGPAEAAIVTSVVRYE
ncbi:MAG TPA: anti-sigma factor, partial [Rhodospirillaceae bacterium]|nr:anti-sigma factor [Rhodospirillaceae bacterium]